MTAGAIPPTTPTSLHHLSSTASSSPPPILLPISPPTLTISPLYSAHGGPSSLASNPSSSPLNTLTRNSGPGNFIPTILSTTLFPIGPNIILNYSAQCLPPWPPYVTTIA